MFWKEKERENVKLSIVALAVFILVFVCAFAIVVFFWIYNSAGMENTIEVQEDTNQEKVVIVLSEKEIKENYIKEINELKVRVQEVNKNSDEILVDAEYVFLSVSVPNELRDLHMKRFLEFKALEKESVRIEELRIRMREILNLEL